MHYAVAIEKGERNYSAYVPDLPGCVSAEDTPEEVKAEIREAIEFHLEGMRQDGCRSLSRPARRTMSRLESGPRRSWCRREARMKGYVARPAPNTAASPRSAPVRA
jgi:predicted RNase H-like HicB family nuclease